MPLPLSDLTESRVDTQVAVIGSSLAGTEVATRLAAAGHHVTVLESGLDEFDPWANALNDAQFVGRKHRSQDNTDGFQEFLDDRYRGRNRVRQLGGTSVTWTGKWRMFGPSDFARRAWIPNSGWPLSYAEIERNYRDVIRDYGFALGPDHPLDDKMAGHARAFEAAGFKPVTYYKAAETYRTAPVLREAEEPGLRVLVDATATRLELDASGSAVAAVICRSRSGREVRVAARHVVIATGGLEAPRVLLASNTERPAGLGNGHDLVGRYYQDHPKISRAVLAAGPRIVAEADALQLSPAPRRHLCLGLPEADQEAMQILDSSVFLKPLYESAARKALSRLRGRPMMRDGTGAWSRFSVTFTMEQAPNPESRITLANERDALGVPKMVVDWRFTDLDRRSFTTSAQAIAKRLRESGLGVMDYGSGETADLEQSMDAAHHMGTTRMGATPRDGVVNTHCTVFDVPNLHVASSAVFPTGASYSPTLTILALSRRVVEHVDASLSRPAAVQSASHAAS